MIWCIRTIRKWWEVLRNRAGIILRSIRMDWHRLTFLLGLVVMTFTLDTLIMIYFRTGCWRMKLTFWINRVFTKTMRLTIWDRSWRIYRTRWKVDMRYLGVFRATAILGRIIAIGFRRGIFYRVGIVHRLVNLDR